MGDEVPSSDGRFLVVVGLTWTERIETVYNFGVEGFRTYFVGESGAWVHNCFDKVRKYLKGTKRGDISEEKVEKLIKEDGFDVRWKEKGGGKRMHFEDADGNIRARIDPGKDGSPRHMHLYNKKGESLDVDGNVVGRKNPAAHIPLE